MPEREMKYPQFEVWDDEAKEETYIKFLVPGSKLGSVQIRLTWTQSDELGALIQNANA
jgi:hypothetical protein